MRSTSPALTETFIITETPGQPEEEKKASFLSGTAVGRQRKGPNAKVRAPGPAISSRCLGSNQLRQQAARQKYLFSFHDEEAGVEGL